MARSVDIDIILNDRFSAAADRIAQSVRDISQQFQTATASAENLSRSVSDAGNLSRGVDRVAAKTRAMTDNMRSFGQASERVGRNLFRRMTLPIVSIGGVMAASAVGFESAMLRVRSLSQANDSDFKKLTESARIAGRESVFSNTEAARGQQFLTQAGFEVDDVIGALPGTLNLAAAAQLGLAETADISSNIMSVFNIEAAEMANVADTLAFVNAKANVNVSQLGQSFKFVGARAASMGLEMKDAAAILGTLGNAGIQASMAGTSMRAMLDRLLLPTGNAAKILRALGIETTTAEGGVRDLFDILQEFKDKGVSDQAISAIFGARASTAVTIMIDKLDETRELMRAIGSDSEDAAEIMAAMNIAGVAGSLRLLRSAFADVSQELFDKDVLMDIRSVIITLQQGMLGFSDSLTPAGKRVIAFGGISLAALGPVALALGKTILIVGAIKKFALFGAFTAALIPLLKIAAVVGLIAGAIAGMVVGLNKLRGIGEFTGTGIKDVSETLQAVTDPRGVGVESISQVAEAGKNVRGAFGFVSSIGVFDKPASAISSALSTTGDFFRRAGETGIAGASGFQRIAAAEVGVSRAGTMSADDKIGKIDVDVDINDPGGNVKSVKVASKGSSRLDMGSNFSGVR